MGNVIFEAVGVTYRYPGAVQRGAVQDVDLVVGQGELVGFVGPNGSGKTTLLRLLLGTLEPDSGSVLSFGRPAVGWRRRELARMIGVVSQREEPAFPLRVDQAVLFGRYPHLGPLGGPKSEDIRAVECALERCDVSHLRERWVGTLSGGEWQRVRIARALAQEPKALALDEATASLDVRHEMEVLELVAHLVREAGITGVLVTHNLNVAARYVDRLVVMHEGRARAVGEPNQVLTREVLESVFGWPVAMTQWNGIAQFVPLKSGEIQDSELNNGR